MAGRTIPAQKYAFFTHKGPVEMITETYQAISAVWQPEKRLVGCCRDAALLFCTMARHQHIASRTRVGLSRAKKPGTRSTGVGSERSEETESKWRF